MAWEGAYAEDPQASLRIEAAPLGGRVARRNVRSGRGDARGARRLGFAVAFAIGAAWMVSEHTFSASDINAFIEMLVFVAASGGITWALYLAVEPFMRRQAPEALIGWTRFVDGRWGDPLVGRRDLLLGCAAGVLSRLLVVVPRVLSPANIGAASDVVLPYWSVTAATVLTSVFWALGWALWLYGLFRLGMLVFLAMSTVSVLLASTLPTLDASAWYGSTIIALILFAALAGYAFYRCVEWKGGLAEALGGD